MPKSSMPKPKKETSIPLHCILCPKNPQFSDVSHLLTHISSKGHLSHRFKLQIRSQSEMEAKQQLDDFDNWYNSNNLESMLMDRAAAKDQKQTSKERRSRVSAAPVKKEKREIPMEPSMASTPVFRAPVPRVHLWPVQQHPESQSSASLSEWEPVPVYATPTTRRAVPNFMVDATPTTVSKIDPNLKTPWKPNDDDEEARPASGEPKLSDSIKLKGIQWPGMDLFDSATPEMRRMRNQRKDNSVLKHMEATSREITTDEIVYNMDGTIDHIRDIFDPLSCDTTPVKKSPSPRKRRPRTKPVLGDMNVNAPRIRAPRAAKKFAVAESPVKRPISPQPSHRQFGYQGLNYQAPTLNPLAGFGRNYLAENEAEFKMTMVDIGTKKRGFSIFQDEEVSPERTQSVQTESPLEDLEPRFEFGIPMLAPYPSRSPANLVSPTPVAKPASMRLYGKENGQPEMPSQIQLRRTTTSMSTHIYPPQVLYDPMFSNPLYNPYHQGAYARSFPMSLQPGFQAPRTPQGGSSSFHGAFKPTNPSARSPSKSSYGYGYGQPNTNIGSRPGSSQGPGVGHGNDHRMSNGNSRPTLSYGPGAGHGNGGNTTYTGNSSRPTSSHSAGVDNGKSMFDM